MKKLLLGTLIAAATIANAQMTNMEKGMAIGTGVGYAQVIAMNVKIEKDDYMSYCLGQASEDVNMRNKSDEMLTKAVNTCVEQLDKINTSK